MKDKRKALEIIAKKLKDIPWAIYSGTAVEIYTHGKRKGRDIDVIVLEDKIDEVGKRFNVKPTLETREKEGIKIINDYYITTEIDGIPVEFIGKMERFIIEGEEYNPASPENSKKLLEKRKKRRYLGIELSVIPIEEILAQKMIWQRRGQWQDEEDIRMLRKQKINLGSLIEALNRWGVSKDEQKRLLEKYKSLLNL